MLARAPAGSLPARVAVDDRNDTGISAALKIVPFHTTPATTAIPSKTIRAFGSTAFASPGRVGGVFLGCFNSTPCTGVLTITVGNTVIGQRPSETISPDDGGIVHVSLTTAGQSMLVDAQGTSYPCAPPSPMPTTTPRPRPSASSDSARPSRFRPGCSRW